MSSKVNIAAVAALVVAYVAPAAQSYAGAYLTPERQLHTQAKHQKAKVPSDARGSVADPDVFSVPAVRSNGRWLETDPDPRIRFEMNRDDRDRRAG